MWAAAAMEQNPESIALYGVLGTIITGMGTTLVYVIKGHNEARAANRAVNNVDGPTISANVAHIVEQVEELRAAQKEFRDRGWHALPPDLGTSAGLTDVIRDLQRSTVDQLDEHKLIMGKLEQMDAEIQAHVAWEMSKDGKYRQA